MRHKFGRFWLEHGWCTREKWDLGLMSSLTAETLLFVDSDLLIKMQWYNCIDFRHFVQNRKQPYCTISMWNENWPVSSEMLDKSWILFQAKLREIVDLAWCRKRFSSCCDERINDVQSSAQLESAVELGLFSTIRMKEIMQTNSKLVESTSLQQENIICYISSNLFLTIPFARLLYWCKLVKKAWLCKAAFDQIWIDEEHDVLLYHVTSTFRRLNCTWTVEDFHKAMMLYWVICKRSNIEALSLTHTSTFIGNRIKKCCMLESRKLTWRQDRDKKCAWM